MQNRCSGAVAPLPRRLPPCFPSQCQMNPVSDAGPRAAVATAVSVAIRWLGATEGHQSRQLAADDGELLTAMPASGPLRRYLFPNHPTPRCVSMQVIPFILLSAHFNNPPRYVLPSPPHPKGVMKGDWLIREAGAMPQAGPTEQTDCNNPPIV